VTVGNICHDNRVVFGVGVNDAHRLEATVARYPRIILSQKAMQASRIPSFSLVAHSRDSPPLRRTIPSSSTGRDPWPRRTAPALG
jgi:hypothetical protein